jgi:hypothetical protein
MKEEQIKNFWRLHRPAHEAAAALGISLAEAEAVYEAMDVCHQRHEARKKALAKT